MNKRVVFSRANHNPNILVLGPVKYQSYTYTMLDLQQALMLDFTISSLDFIDYDAEGDVVDADFTYSNALGAIKTLEVYRDWWNSIRGESK